MLHVALFTAAALDKTLAFLAPLFLDTPAADIAAARQAASATLAGYAVRSDRELRLAALIIAFSFGALDALSRAINPVLSMNQMLRLHGNANALNRAAHLNETRLLALQRQSAGEPLSEADPPIEVLPASIATQDLVAFTRPAPKAAPAIASASPAAPLSAPPSRQQRRAAERQAEKLRRSQEEKARRAQRVARLGGITTAPAVSGTKTQGVQPQNCFSSRSI
jgi:hypothetical protein